MTFFSLELVVVIGCPLFLQKYVFLMNTFCCFVWLSMIFSWWFLVWICIDKVNSISSYSSIFLCKILNFSCLVGQYFSTHFFLENKFLLIRKITFCGKQVSYLNIYNLPLSWHPLSSFGSYNICLYYTQIERII